MPVVKIRALESMGLSGESWKIEVSTERGVFVTTLKDPFNQVQEEELRWSLEEYALNSLLSKTRACVVSAHVSSYRESLVEQLDDALSHVLGKSSIGDIQLEIYSDQSDRSLQTLHWEALEAVSGRTFTINRLLVTSKDDERRTVSTRKSQSPHRILLVTARSMNEPDADVSYRLVARPLNQIIKEISKSQPTELKILRPATSDALRAELVEKPVGYYDIVHLDVCGQISRDGAPELMMFSPSDQEKLVGTSAATLGALFSQRHIEIVILHNCQSSRQGLGLNADLAANLIKHGVMEVLELSYALPAVSAKAILDTFYHFLLVEKMNATLALSQTRRSLARWKTREAVLEKTVDLEDFLVPILYKSRDATNYEIQNSSPSKIREISKLTKHAPCYTSTPMFGRDFDLLRLETFLILRSNIVELNGPAGSGKSTLVDHALEWWRETGFITKYVTIDPDQDLKKVPVARQIVAQLAPSQDLESAAISSILDLAKEAFRDERIALIFDQAEPRMTRIYSQDAYELQYFLRSLPKAIVIFISDGRASATLGLPKLSLMPLSQSSACQLTLHCLQNSSWQGTKDSVQQAFFHKCVHLLDRNPLAIKSAFPNWFEESQHDFRSLFKSMLLNEKISPYWMTEESGRRFMSTLTKAIDGLGPVVHQTLLFSVTPFMLCFKRHFRRQIFHLMLLGKLPIYRAVARNQKQRDKLQEHMNELVADDQYRWEFGEVLIALVRGGFISSTIDESQMIYFRTIPNDIDDYIVLHPLLPFALRYLISKYKQISYSEVMAVFSSVYQDYTNLWFHNRSPSNTDAGVQYEVRQARIEIHEQFMNCYSVVLWNIQRPTRKWGNTFPTRLMAMIGEILLGGAGIVFDHTYLPLIEDLLKSYLKNYRQTSGWTNTKTAYQHKLEAKGSREVVNGGACGPARAAIVASMILCHYYFVILEEKDFQRQLHETEELYNRFLDMFPEDASGPGNTVIKSHLEYFKSFTALWGNDAKKPRHPFEKAKDYLDTPSSSSVTAVGSSVTAVSLNDTADSSSTIAAASSGIPVSMTVDSLRPFLFPDKSASNDQPRSDGQSALQPSSEQPEMVEVKESKTNLAQHNGISGSTPMIQSHIDDHSDEQYAPSHPRLGMGVATIQSLVPNAPAQTGVTGPFGLDLLEILSCLQDIGKEDEQIVSHAMLATQSLEEGRWEDGLLHCTAILELLGTRNISVEGFERNGRDGRELALCSVLVQSGYAAINLHQTEKAKSFLSDAYRLCSFENNTASHRILLCIVLRGLMHVTGEPLPGMDVDLHPELFSWPVQYISLLYDPTLEHATIEPSQRRRSVTPIMGVTALKRMLAECRRGEMFERLFLGFFIDSAGTFRDDVPNKLLRLSDELDIDTLLAEQLLSEVLVYFNEHMDELSSDVQEGRNSKIWVEAECVLFGTAEDCKDLQVLVWWGNRNLRRKWPANQPFYELVDTSSESSLVPDYKS